MESATEAGGPSARITKSGQPDRRHTNCGRKPGCTGKRAKMRGEGLDPIDVEIGRIIYEARTAAGMPQQQLAGLIGVAFQQLQKNERGFNRVSVARLFHIARALHMTPAELLGGVSPAAVRDSIRLHTGGVDIEAPEGAGESRREMIELSRVYQGIRDPNIRSAVRRMIADLAHADPGSPIHDGPRRGRPPKRDAA